MTRPPEIVVRLADGAAVIRLLEDVAAVCVAIESGRLPFVSEVRDELLAALERFADDDDDA